MGKVLCYCMKNIQKVQMIRAPKEKAFFEEEEVIQQDKIDTNAIGRQVTEQWFSRNKIQGIFWKHD